MSKGSTQRPLKVKRGTFDDNFDRIFGKKESDTESMTTIDKRGVVHFYEGQLDVRGVFNDLVDMKFDIHVDIGKTGEDI